jgi:hypothetical protein
MAKSFQDIMAEARKEIPEVTAQQVNELLKNNGKSPVLLDVRANRLFCLMFGKAMNGARGISKEPCRCRAVFWKSR